MVALKLESAIGSSGLERIGLEQCGLEASKCDWLERARADWARAMWLGSFKLQLVRAGSNGLASSIVALKLEGAIASSGFERIGLAH